MKLTPWHAQDAAASGLTSHRTYGVPPKKPTSMIPWSRMTVFNAAAPSLTACNKQHTQGVRQLSHRLNAVPPPQLSCSKDWCDIGVGEQQQPSCCPSRYECRHVEPKRHTNTPRGHSRCGMHHHREEVTHNARSGHALTSK